MQGLQSFEYKGIGQTQSILAHFRGFLLVQADFQKKAYTVNPRLEVDFLIF